MSFQNDAPIIQKLSDFYQELYFVVEKMPKKDKYSIGSKSQSVTLELLELIIEASHSTQQDKNVTLIKASVKLDVLKLTLRWAYEAKAIDHKKYLSLEEKLQEIGKMLGGWLRATKASV